MFSNIIVICFELALFTIYENIWNYLYASSCDVEFSKRVSGLELKHCSNSITRKYECPRSDIRLVKCNVSMDPLQAVAQWYIETNKLDNDGAPAFQPVFPFSRFGENQITFLIATYDMNHISIKVRYVQVESTGVSNVWGDWFLLPRSLAVFVLNELELCRTN